MDIIYPDVQCFGLWPFPKIYGIKVFISLLDAPPSASNAFVFVCMNVTDVPVCSMLSLPSQSFNDKRKKNFILTRKFPFYKNKEGEQDGSDSDSK